MDVVTHGLTGALVTWAGRSRPKDERRVTAPRLAVLALASAAALPAALAPDTGEPRYAEEALAAAAAADKRMRETHACDPVDIQALAGAVVAIEARAGLTKEGDAKPRRWKFPIAGVKPLESIGGWGKDHYENVKPKLCFAASGTGHAGHDLFAPDPNHGSRDRKGKPFEALAVDKGVVLITRDDWTPEDGTKGGNYVLLSVPSRRAVAYYAHLDGVLVKPGERVPRGGVLGHVGRTGLNAEKHRSPTHLHFALWDAATFVPINPYRWLKEAE